MNVSVVLERDPVERMRLAAWLSEQPGVNVFAIASADELPAVLDAQDVSIAIVGRVDGVPRRDVVRSLLDAGCRGVMLTAVEPNELDFEFPRNVHLASGLANPARVRLILRRYLQPSREFSPAFRVPELLQMLCLSHASGLVVGSREGRDVGTIEVVEGEVWGARDALGSGPEALARLCAPSISGRVRALEPETLDARSLHGDWQGLLLDALRATDERGLTGGDLDRGPLDDGSGEGAELRWTGTFSALPDPERIAPSTVGEVVPSAPPAIDPSVEEARAFAAQKEEAARALLARDYQRAAVAFRRAAALRPEDEIVRMNLERLRALGYSGEEEPS